MLGSGAWGSVYEARDDDDGCAVALKLLPDPVLAERRIELAEVVHRELDLAARPTLPGCVEVRAVLRADADEPPLRGAYALVMERARASVADLLATAEPGHPVDGAAELLASLWDGLRALHASGWVHGDLKPGNVLVFDDGRVLMADLGLAGELKGTHAYAPAPVSLDYVGPEWWSERVGVEGVVLRPARDLWAFGVLAHQVLSGGRFCFDGQDATARSRAAQECAAGAAPLRLDPAVPAGWAEVLQRLLTPSEDDRLRARDEVDRSIAALRRREVPGPTRRRGVAAVAAGLAVVVAGGAAALTLSDAGGSGPGAASAPPAAAVLAGDLRAGTAVPHDLRGDITAAARGCEDAAVTPALLAAILEVQSGFDAAASDERRGEYGVALWTPSIFDQWAVDHDGGGASVFSPSDSIYALVQYLCAKATVVSDVPGDRGLLLAAAFLTSADRVVAAGGVPPDARARVERIAAARDQLGVSRRPGGTAER
nr:protein kinase [Nocardioides flavescens]